MNTPQGRAPDAASGPTRSSDVRPASSTPATVAPANRATRATVPQRLLTQPVNQGLPPPRDQTETLVTPNAVSTASLSLSAVLST